MNLQCPHLRAIILEVMVRLDTMGPLALSGHWRCPYHSLCTVPC